MSDEPISQSCDGGLGRRRTEGASRRQRSENRSMIPTESPWKLIGDRFLFSRRADRSSKPLSFPEAHRRASRRLSPVTAQAVGKIGTGDLREVLKMSLRSLAEDAAKALITTRPTKGPDVEVRDRAVKEWAQKLDD